MTNEEEIKKQEEGRAINVKKTLESMLIQNTVGSNLVRADPSKYGTLGVQSAEEFYRNAMSSEDAQKIKNSISNEKSQQGKQLGVYGEPAVTDYDISTKIAQQLEEVMGIANLSELEKYSKKVGANLDFKVPEELKKYSGMELQMKAVDRERGRLDMQKLSQPEQEAFALYQILSESYKRACALNTSQANYFSDLNAQGKEIADKYKSKKKEQ